MEGFKRGNHAPFNSEFRIPNSELNKRTGCRTAHLSFYGSKIYPNGTQKYPVGPKKNYFLTAASLFLNLSRRPPASTNFCLPV